MLFLMNFYEDNKKPAEAGFACFGWVIIQITGISSSSGRATSLIRCVTTPRMLTSSRASPSSASPSSVMSDAPMRFANWLRPQRSMDKLNEHLVSIPRYTRLTMHNKIKPIELPNASQCAFFNGISLRTVLIKVVLKSKFTTT